MAKRRTRQRSTKACFLRLHERQHAAIASIDDLATTKRRDAAQRACEQFVAYRNTCLIVYRCTCAFLAPRGAWQPPEFLRPSVGTNDARIESQSLHEPLSRAA